MRCAPGRPHHRPCSQRLFHTLLLKTEKGGKTSFPWDRLTATKREEGIFWRQKSKERGLSKFLTVWNWPAMASLAQSFPFLLSNHLEIQILAEFTRAHLAGRPNIKLISRFIIDCPRYTRLQDWLLQQICLLCIEKIFGKVINTTSQWTRSMLLVEEKFHHSQPLLHNRSGLREATTAQAPPLRKYQITCNIPECSYMHWGKISKVVFWFKLRGY